MKRGFTIFFVAIWFIFTGMGQPPVEVPKPSISFSATVIDDQEIATKCQQVSWNGEVSFVGRRGKGVVSIPFERVKKVVFLGEAREGKRDSQMILRDGEIVAVTFNEDDRFYGITNFGNYRITAKNIKEIVFE